MKVAGFSIVALLTSVGLAQSPPIIRVPVRLVDVPTAVVSKSGQMIRGLRAADFLLSDNDRPQSFRLDSIDQPLSVAVVIQNNDAVRTWRPAVQRVASMVEALLIGNTGEASLSLFGSEVRLVQPLTADSNLVDKAFQTIAPSSSGKERTRDAMVQAARQLEQASPERRRVILLVAQAGDVGSESGLSDVLRELDRGNIAVYSLVMPHIGRSLIGKTISVKDAKSAFHRDDIGIVGGVDLSKLVPEIYRAEKAAAGQDDLSIMTGESGGRQSPFRTLRDLEAGISAISEELHTEYVLSYTPDRYDTGYHRIRVKVERADAVVRARPGYYVPPSDGEK